MGKARDANGVEELFDNSLCGNAAGLMAPADGTHGGENGDAGVGGGGHSPPSPCPTEVIDLWSNWIDDEETEEFGSQGTTNSSSSGRGLSTSGTTTDTEQSTVDSNYDDGSASVVMSSGPEGPQNDPQAVGNNNNQEHQYRQLARLVPVDILPNGYYPPMAQQNAYIPLESNQRPDGYGTEFQQQIPIYNNNGGGGSLPPPGNSLIEHPVPSSNFVGAPIYYALTGDCPPPPPPPPPAGQVYGGPVLAPNQVPQFMGNPGNHQPVIFVPQQMYPHPQQQNLMGVPPPHVMVDQYGNNPRSAWDSLLAPRRGYNGNVTEQSEYYTAYGGSYGGGSGWNGGVATDSSTYYSYGGGSCSVSELSSTSDSPTKSQFSSADSSFTSLSSFDSSNGTNEPTYAPVAWTQHPTFNIPKPQSSQVEYQANYSGNLHENMCPMNAYPVPMKMNYPGNDHPFPQQISNQFGGYNASNQSNARAPLDSEGTASNTKNKKGGRGFFVRNKKKSTASDKPISPAVTGVLSLSYAVDCGYTFLMNGVELPFVLNIWDPSVTAMMLKMAPSRSYEYYVPPCVSDGDFFGGQISMWQFRMVHYFEKFRPDFWRIQAVPDISRNIADGWFSFEIVSKLRFCCRNCKMPWTTKKGKLTFIFKRNPENGIGYIYLKMFRQVCMKQECPDWTVQTPACYPEEIERAISKLCDLIASLYYGAPLDPSLFIDCQKSIRVSPGMPSRSKSSNASSKFQDKAAV